MKLDLLFECANILYNADIDDPNQQKAISVAENYILNSYNSYKNYCITENIEPLNKEEYLYEIVNEAPVNPQAIMQILSMYGGGYNPMMMQPRPMPMYNPYGMGMGGFGGGLIGAFARGAMQGYQNRVNPQPVQQDQQPVAQPKQPGVVKSFFGGMKDAFFKTPEELQKERAAAAEAYRKSQQEVLPQTIQTQVDPNSHNKINPNLQTFSSNELTAQARERLDNNEKYQKFRSGVKDSMRSVQKAINKGTGLTNKTDAKTAADMKRIQDLKDNPNLSTAERNELHKLQGKYATDSEIRQKQTNRAVAKQTLTPEEQDQINKMARDWAKNSSRNPDGTLNMDQYKANVEIYKNMSPAERSNLGKQVNNQLQTQNMEINKQRQEIENRNKARTDFLNNLNNDSNVKDKVKQHVNSLNRDELDAYMKADENGRIDILNASKKRNQKDRAMKAGQNISSRVGSAISTGLGTVFGAADSVKTGVRKFATGWTGSLGKENKQSSNDNNTTATNESIKIEFISLLEEYNMYEDGIDIMSDLVYRHIISEDVFIEYALESDNYDKNIILKAFTEALIDNGIYTKTFTEPLTPSIRVPATIQERGYRF